MNKNCVKNTKYAINWDSHPQNFVKNVCSLMEHQSLVDIVISCGNNTIQAHKFILASNSPLFREEFEKNPSIEQILISGCDFSVLKSVVEIMYCGQTVVTEENVKFLIAMVKLFQLKNLENLFNDHSGSGKYNRYLLRNCNH
ncbi:longitudinals lacking protein-like [Rhynchophorus ferrugineus]|uniref:longitudinals lacking protein-like n=1 Tax=Rhynchophorus ferrugineus TaxID=354439 RepID=UPI003FCC88C2